MSVSELVKARCGYVTAANERLFESVLGQQGLVGDEGVVTAGQAQLTSCLPAPDVRFTWRDRVVEAAIDQTDIERYFAQDIGKYFLDPKDSTIPLSDLGDLTSIWNPFSGEIMVAAMASANPEIYNWAKPSPNQPFDGNDWMDVLSSINPTDINPAELTQETLAYQNAQTGAKLVHLGWESDLNEGSAAQILAHSWSNPTTHLAGVDINAQTQALINGASGNVTWVTPPIWEMGTAGTIAAETVPIMLHTTQPQYHDLLLQPPREDAEKNKLFQIRTAAIQPSTAYFAIDPIVTKTINQDSVCETSGQPTCPLPQSVQSGSFIFFSEVEGQKCAAALPGSWGAPDFPAAFQQAVFRAAMRRSELGFRRWRTDVMVVDSGFGMVTGSSPFLSPPFMTVGWREANELLDTEDEKIRVHGTAVATLAAGGPDFWAISPTFGLNINVNSRNIFSEFTIRSDSSIIQIDAEKLASAIGRSDVDIVNMSFASRDKSGFDWLEQQGLLAPAGPLLVVAAGNNGQNSQETGQRITSSDMFPQAFVGTSDGRGQNILVVAAMDGAALAGFSNYSPDLVDIAAPGCAVGTWQPRRSGQEIDHEDVALSGTSFAAPIVSYVASLVHSLYPDKDGLTTFELKSRLLASADLVPELFGLDDEKIKHGRVLNPIKAVSLYHDILEINMCSTPPCAQDQRELRIGKILNQPPSGFKMHELCERSSIDVDRILKFATPLSGNLDKALIYYEADGVNAPVFGDVICDRLPKGVFQFRDLKTGKVEKILLDDVHDAVFRVVY